MLKEKGCGIIYISHKMEEILRISDYVTIMRDGKHIATKKSEDITINEIIKLMVGRELNNRYPPKSHEKGETLLRVNNLSGLYNGLDYADALPIEDFWSKLEYKGTSVVIKTEAQLSELINKFRSENNSALQLTVFDMGVADFDVKKVLDGYAELSLHQFSFGGLTEYTIYVPMESYDK